MLLAVPVMLAVLAPVMPWLSPLSPGAIAEAAPAPASAGPADSVVAYTAELMIDEPGFDAKLRIRVYHQPGYLKLPGSVGHLFMVIADSSSGRDAFFIPNDLAFELGESQLYRVEYEQVTDPFGQSPGGRLRPGETQLGFVMVPEPVDFDRYLPLHPDSVVIRYAHHRAPLRRATAAEVRWWTESISPPFTAAALNAWWDWAEAMSKAPGMNAGEARFFSERILPGQGHLLAQEGISPQALRNAILRVGERRLLEGPARQRVGPRYPAVAQQAGAGGLVVALCYIDADGAVADASILASNTVHMLNLAALSAAMEWRFPRVEDESGQPLDGWRLLPFQFRAPGAEASAAESEDDTTMATGGLVPPRIVKTVEPEYPERARQKRIEGTVVYRVTIDERGKLVQAFLEMGVHPLLDQAALVALEQMLFVPGTRYGRPVRADITVPFTFGKTR